MDNRITVRFPPLLLAKLLQEAKDDGRTRQDMIIRIIELHYKGGRRTA